MSNALIWPIDKTLSGTSTLDQSGPGSNANKWLLCIPQSITGTSPSDCFVSYPGHSLEEFYPSAEMQSVYSAVPDFGKNAMAIENDSFYLFWILILC